MRLLVGTNLRRSTRLLVLAPLLLAAGLHVWVDEHGRTYVTDDASRVPEGAHAAGDVAGLRALWEDGFAGPPLSTPPGASGSDEDRVLRLLRDAVDDLRRGETARATALLAEVLRQQPNRPEAHWYLALLSGRRGRLDAAEMHLRLFLSAAGPSLDDWRASAERRLARLADERRLMESPEAEALRLVDVAHESFRIQADAALLGADGADFAGTVARYLEDARAALAARLGVEPSEPFGVVLYGRAAYRKAHGHRFSFQTVGFFDGRIHVASAAHPAGELRGLLFHEYTHALFRERTGGDRPFWLNEGLATLAERSAAGREGVTRGERRRLAHAAAGDAWIPLHRLAASFSGLTDGDARLAYLVSTTAAAWLEARTTPEGRARLLERLGEGAGADEVLREAVGLDTQGIDAALRAELRGAF
jgi:hypothetical protein